MKSSPSETSPGGPAGRLFARIRTKMAYYFKRYGWKVGVAIFLYYLVRDTVLYIILPLWIAGEILR